MRSLHVHVRAYVRACVCTHHVRARMCVGVCVHTCVRVYVLLSHGANPRDLGFGHSLGTELQITGLQHMLWEVKHVVLELCDTQHTFK